MGNNADDFETWAYMVKLANLKQSENVEPKESSMQKYLDKVSKLSQKIDNLQKFNYNEVFVKRTVFPNGKVVLNSIVRKEFKTGMNALMAIAKQTRDNYKLAISPMFVSIGQRGSSREKTLFSYV